MVKIYLVSERGFLMLEAGRVRSKNSISVAQKNVSDMVISWIAFFLFGHWLMFGNLAPLAADRVSELLRDSLAGRQAVARSAAG